MELSTVQRRIRDFYFKEGLAAPSDVTHVHRPNLVPDQQLFSIERPKLKICSGKRLL